MDSSAPSVNFAEQYPRGGKKKGPARNMLFDVARGLARRVPLTKLVELDGDIRPYLASLMVSALHRAGDRLFVPSDMKIEKMATKAFNDMLAEKSG